MTWSLLKAQGRARICDNMDGTAHYNVSSAPPEITYAFRDVPVDSGWPW